MVGEAATGNSLSAPPRHLANANTALESRISEPSRRRANMTSL